MQPDLFSTTLTVSQLTFRIRRLLEDNPELQDVWVEGEISNLSRPASGHIYFTLKDDASQIKGIIWRSTAQRLKFDSVFITAETRLGSTP